MPTCPHCGEKIERVAKVHYKDAGHGAGSYAACNWSITAYDNLFTTDRSRVTCLSCIRTKAYKESE